MRKKSSRKKATYYKIDTIGFYIGDCYTQCLQDRDGVKLVLKELQHKYPLLKKILANGGYGGTLIEWTIFNLGWTLEIVAKVAGLSRFTIILKRWIVKRTFGWFNFNRRLAKDYEVVNDCSVAFVHITMIRVMLNRIKFRQPLSELFYTLLVKILNLY